MHQDGCTGETSTGFYGHVQYRANQIFHISTVQADCSHAFLVRLRQLSCYQLLVGCSAGSNVFYSCPHLSRQCYAQNTTDASKSFHGALHIVC